VPFYKSYLNKQSDDQDDYKKIDLNEHEQSNNVNSNYNSNRTKVLSSFANAYNKLKNSSKSQSYSSSTDGISGPSKETQTTVVTANPDMNINGTSTEYDSYGNSSIVSESWVKSKAGKI